MPGLRQQLKEDVRLLGSRWGHVCENGVAWANVFDANGFHVEDYFCEMDGKIILNGQVEEPMSCDYEIRSIEECNGFRADNRSFETDLWEEFKQIHNIEISNYDWCIKILNCEVSIGGLE